MRHYKLFGTLDIRDEAAPAELLKSNKGCAILVYLIIRKETQQREHIGDLLWETETTKQSLASLRGLLNRLRSVAPEFDVTRKTITFAPDAGSTVDVYAVDAVLNDTRASSEQIDEALRLYTGDLLSGFYIEDAPRFNEWLIFARERWRRRVLVAYRRLCESYASAEQYAEGINAARRWRDLDDLDEDAWRMTMRLLAENNEASAALREYDACRQRLMDELGVEPEPATTKLVEQIRERAAKSFTWEFRQQAAMPELPAVGELADVGLLPPNSYMPHHRNDDFLGRREPLLRLAKLLLPAQEAARPTTRATAITGIGGLGKTQLAVEFAFRYGRFFAGGVYWLSFAEEDSVVDEVSIVAGSQGMKLYREAEQLPMKDKIGRFKTACQEATPRLLIFDNCEDETLLAQWLPVTGGGRVLMTSRRATWSRELGVETVALETLMKAESVELVTQLAPHITKETAHDIAHAVGHLPLALHLAGSFLARYQQMTGQQYLQQLEKMSLRHPSLQGRGTTFSPTGHSLNVMGTFALNFEQLDSAEPIDQIARQLLACAACFAPGEPLPRRVLLATVLDEDDDIIAELTAEDGLMRLIELGFLTIENPTAVSLHRLIVDFARSTLTSFDADHIVAQTMLRLLNRVIDQRPDYAVLPFSTSHLRQLVDRALTRQAPSAIDLGRYLSLHLNHAGDSEGARLYLDRIVPLARATSGGRRKALLFYTAAGLHHMREAFELAQSFYEEAAQLMVENELGDDILALLIDSGMGAVQSQLGNSDNVDLLFERIAIEMEKRVDIAPRDRLTLFGNRSRYYFEIGDYAQAMAIAKQSLVVLEQAFTQELYIETVRLMTDIGTYQSIAGNHSAARQTLLKTLPIAQSLLDSDNHHIILTILGNLGVAEWRIGDFELARHYFERILRASQQLYPSNSPSMADALNDVGEVLCRLGEYDAAVEHHQRALAIRQQIFGEQHIQTLRSLSMVGEVALRRGNFTEAKALLGQALAGQESAEQNPQAISDTCLLLGETHLALGEMSDAFEQISRAVTIRTESFGIENGETAWAIFILGTWFSADSQPSVAREHYEQALAILEKTTAPTHPYIQQVQSHIAALLSL